MEYTVSGLGKTAGVSTRTLRYYDKINLLKPSKINSSGYRIYSQKEVDLLQQILFYRELGMSLENIRSITASPDFDKVKALSGHLADLVAKRNQLDLLIANAQKTIACVKGETVMSDKEKFEGFKQKLVDDNEKQYGPEIRAKYGDDAVDRANAKILEMTVEQSEEAETLRLEMEETLKAAFGQGDPAGELAQKACELHKKWLCFYYDKYSRQYHMGLAEMYVNDRRFAEYYNKLAVGCAEFLRDSIMIYCK